MRRASPTGGGAKQLITERPGIGRGGRPTIIGRCSEDARQRQPLVEAQPLVPGRAQPEQALLRRPGPLAAGCQVAAAPRGVGQPHTRLADDRTRGRRHRQPLGAHRRIAVRHPVAVRPAGGGLVVGREAGERGDEQGEGHRAAVDQDLGAVTESGEPGARGPVRRPGLLGDVGEVQEYERVEFVARAGRVGRCLAARTCRREACPPVGAGEQRPARGEGEQMREAFGTVAHEGPHLVPARHGD